MELDSLKAARRWEAEQLLPWFSGDVLEVGAGTGTQAAVIAQHHPVVALEVVSADPTFAGYQLHQDYPVNTYEGPNLPSDSGAFDTVFTSNVLEHIPDVQAFLAECGRVLRPGGRMVMVTPSASWRLWSIVAYYPARARDLLSRSDVARSAALDRGKVRLSWFYPSTHGERGNTVTELVWFTRWRWRREFHRAGLDILEERPLRLFYTGEDLTALPVSVRRRLSLGAPSRAFLLTQGR